MKQFLALTGLLFILTFCSKGNSAEIDTTNTAETKLNVAYGNDPRQNMDIYLPENRDTDNTKVMVLIHGGGWSDGDKSDFTPFFFQINQRFPGYAIFNLNYRLARDGDNFFPAQENDIRKAIEFIYSKREEYKISGQFVYVGISAGAHLALLQAYKYNSPVRPKAVASFFGPTELTIAYSAGADAVTILQQATGTTPTANPAIYQQSSPANFVNGQTPPTILLQGGMDELVDPSQAELLRDKLNLANVPNQYVFYPSEGHGWGGAPMDDSFDKIKLFFATHVN